MLPRKARFFILSGVFLAGILAALLVWGRLTLPFRNPLQVVGYCTQIQFNPQSDILRFLLFVLLPSIFLILFYALTGRKLGGFVFQAEIEEPSPENNPGGKSFRHPWITSLLLIYAALIALNVPTYHAFGKFDSYHEGESLGTAICYLAGERPYRDFLFFHGLVQDPLRSVWAFQLFGKGIAAERTFESIAKVLAWLSLALFLDKLFQRRVSLVAAFLSLLALGYVGFTFLGWNFFVAWDPSPASVLDQFQKHRSFWENFNLLIITPRALMTFLFLLVFIQLEHSFREDRAGKGAGFWVTVFFFSFIPFAALGYAVDSGLFILVAYVLLHPVFYLLFVRSRPWRGKWILGSSLGALAALLILEALTQGGLWDALRFIFVVSPAYKGLSESVPVPIHNLKFLFFFTLLAALTYRFVWLGLREKLSADGDGWLRSFLQKNLVEGALLALAGFHFLNALIRGDEEHLIYSLSLLYVLAFYVAAGLTQKAPEGWKRSGERFLVGLTVLIALFCLVRDVKTDILKANFPLGSPDEAFISPNDQKTIRFLKANMAPLDDFFTMTSEASWYYYLDKACPTRFPYVWVAAPMAFQEEVVRDLAAKKVKWVLYQDDDWSDWIDGISNIQKFPLVSQFVRDHYRPFQNLDGNDIWVLKDGV